MGRKKHQRHKRPYEFKKKLAAWAAQRGTARVVLAHLSQENNTPGMALAAAEQALGALGLGTRDVELIAAPRDGSTGWFEV